MYVVGAVFICSYFFQWYRNNTVHGTPLLTFWWLSLSLSRDYFFFFNSLCDCFFHSPDAPFNFLTTAGFRLRTVNIRQPVIQLTNHHCQRISMARTVFETNQEWTYPCMQQNLWWFRPFLQTRKRYGGNGMRKREDSDWPKRSRFKQSSLTSWCYKQTNLEATTGNKPSGNIWFFL